MSLEGPRNQLLTVYFRDETNRVSNLSQILSLLYHDIPIYLLLFHNIPHSQREGVVDPNSMLREARTCAALLCTTAASAGGTPSSRSAAL